MVRTEGFNINGKKISFLPRDSNFGSYLKAFIIVLLEQSSNFQISEYDCPSNNNRNPLLCDFNKYIIQGPPNNFFLENALKKLPNIFSNFFFYLKV